MKKAILAAGLGVGLCVSGASAQTLQPQMSTQDIRTGMQEVEGTHVLVPILMMIFLIATAGGGAANPAAPIVTAGR